MRARIATQHLLTTPLSHLPPEIFAALPPLRVLVHVFSDQPAERFLVLASGKLREGQTNSDGLTAEQILPEGTIFVFQGQRFFSPR